jgi:hypothetical protein
MGDVTLLISEKKVDAQLAAKYPELRFRACRGRPSAASGGGVAL